MSNSDAIHMIFAHPHHDSAAAEFARAVVTLCGPKDSMKRVDEDVIAPKGRPDAVYLGYFVKFDQHAFIEFVQSILWDFPLGISAFVRDVGAAQFRSIDLGMQWDIGKARKAALKFGRGFVPPQSQAEFLTETFPKLLEGRDDLIRDSIRNPQRFFESYGQMASVDISTPWVFQCIDVYPERRFTSSRRHEFGPGNKDWTMVTIEHRTTGARLAMQGISVCLLCDVSEVGADIFARVHTITKCLQPGDWLRIAGVLEVKKDCECQIEKVHRIEKVEHATDCEGAPGGEVGNE